MEKIISIVWNNWWFLAVSLQENVLKYSTKKNSSSVQYYTSLKKMLENVSDFHYTTLFRFRKKLSLKGQSIK